MMVMMMMVLLWVLSNTTGPEDGEEGSFPRWKIFLVYTKQTALGAFFLAIASLEPHHTKCVKFNGGELKGFL